MPSLSIRPASSSAKSLHAIALFLLLVLGWTPATLGQFGDPSSPALNSSSFEQSLSGTISFLPAEEAYQLSAELSRSDAGTRVNLHWDIADGYYLYQHQLKFRYQGQDYTADLPKGQRKYDDYYERELDVYYHGLDLELLLPAAAYTEKGSLLVHSQGCADAGLCYPPQVQPLELSDGLANLLPSLPPSASASFGSSSLPSLKPESDSSLPQVANNGQATDQGSTYLLWALLGALLGGMILNLMPCVFPVLSLKALSLARSRENPHQQHLHGWAYTAGAVATFVAIAAVMLSLREAGQAIGWGFQLQSPMVVAVLAYLFFVMGLTLSGFIQLGGSLSGAGQSLTEGHSYRSSFFTGALATVVASPCTAPFMGSALGYAVTQPTPIALGVFATLGFGMALPFLLLTYFPSLSQKLPKPGPWMDTLKQALAFPLYLTALWLLWVVGRQTSSDSVIFIIAGAVALAFAAWLWQHKPQRLWQQCAAAAVLAMALWPLGQLHSPAHSQSSGSVALDHNWQPFTQARLEQLLSSGQPTFVNLTADWCITCLANEKVALDTEASLQAFEDANIVKLKGDWTHYNPEITRLLSEFGRNGVPLYLMYNGTPGAQPVILPQILREQTVINAIQQAQQEHLAANSPM